MKVPNVTCECLSPAQNSDWQAELNAFAIIIMTFADCEQCCQLSLFESPTWSWLKRSSSQLTYITLVIRDETHTLDGGPIRCLVTFFVAPNSWSLTWSWHFLPMIITTFLEYTWPGGPMQQNEHALSFYLKDHLKADKHCVAWDHSHHPGFLPWLSWPSDWTRVGGTKWHQACDDRTNWMSLTSDHHSRDRDTDMMLFLVGIGHNYVNDSMHNWSK